jgi:hypothetical protein
MVRIVKHINTDNSVEIDFVGFELWEDFDTLINILLTQMGANIVESLDGIWSRYWTFEIGNMTFKLMHHEDMGNCLCPIQGNEEEIMFLEELSCKMLRYVIESLSKES